MKTKKQAKKVKNSSQRDESLITPIGEVQYLHAEIISIDSCDLKEIYGRQAKDVTVNIYNIGMMNNIISYYPKNMKVGSHVIVKTYGNNIDRIIDLKEFRSKEFQKCLNKQYFINKRYL